VHTFSCRLPLAITHGDSWLTSWCGAQDWRRRCRGVDSLPELRGMLLEAEKLAAPLMDGLPRNAHDEAMDAWPTEPVALLPPLPRDLVRQQHPGNSLSIGASAAVVHGAPAHSDMKFVAPCFKEFVRSVCACCNEQHHRGAGDRAVATGTRPACRASVKC
jgi:hypothetical protein